MQNEYFTGKRPVSYPKGSLQNILKCIDSANKIGIPVILIQHSSPQKSSDTFQKGSQEWELHPEIARSPYDYLVEKKLPGSFTETNLEAYLRKLKIDTVVISGYMTQMCCDTTARQAFHKGFNVEFLSDATGTLDITNYAGKVTAEELHRAILVTQAMQFSTVLSTDEWINRLR